MSKKNNLIYYIVTIAIFLIIIVSVYYMSYKPTSDLEGGPAPDFSAVSLDGESTRLSDHEGEIIVLHFTNIESPLCLECEYELKAQCSQLEKLHSSLENITIITINMRKNPYSETGRSFVENNWDINVTWLWIEDHNPYEISSKYLDYWNLEGGVSNPTILLIDKEQEIVAVRHVYQMGKGKIDGIQTAESLENDISMIESGEWVSQDLNVSRNEITLIGMFALGVITSFSPCSIALLIAMLSYIMATLEPADNSKNHSREGLLIGVFFTIGMASVFFLLGLLLSYIGIFVKNSIYFYMASGILLILLGINNIYPLSEVLDPLIGNIYTREKSGDSFKDKIRNMVISLFDNSLILGAFLLGVFFAFAWAPCAISLILPVFIWVISEGLPFLFAGLLLFVFGLGHGAPIIPLAVISRSARAHVGEKYMALGKFIQKLFGVIIITIGVVMALRFFGVYLW